MTNLNVQTRVGFLSTDRNDRWWIEPLWTGLGCLLFVIYTTWAMFQGNYYWWSAESKGFGGDLSPFYSTLLFFEQKIVIGYLR